MADTLHLKLANTIKNVHQTLREEARKIGEERAWAQHCKQTEILQTYAQAMQLLATEYWEKNASDSNNKRAICRVQWVAQECENYYFRGGVVDGFKKEIALCQRFQIDTEELLEQESEVLKSLESIRVLDVGSCYNPFRKFPRFDVVAVDIAPASSDVQKCDFLNLEILNEGIVPESSNEVLTELPSAYFDVVIFSLLLEYFPSCKQRYICCSKASKLLSPGGILCIVTPDSKHATANSVMMKKWRYALANEGFLRIQYSKLPHLHCMVYRKSIHSSLSKLWLSSAIATDKERGKGFSEGLDELIIIPQDSRPSTDSVINIDPNVRDSNETIASIFANLPAVS